jgi:tetraacyldisaccharide 4'-kinase
MISNAPPFWWRNPGWRAYALKPLSLVYGRISGKTMRRENRPSVDVPVTSQSGELVKRQQLSQ